MYMAFRGSDLRSLRLKLNQSARKISKEIGVHRNTWARIEADGKREVPLTVRLALAAWTRGLPALGDE